MYIQGPIYIDGKWSSLMINSSKKILVIKRTIYIEGIGYIHGAIIYKNEDVFQVEGNDIGLMSVSKSMDIRLMKNQCTLRPVIKPIK